MYPRLRKWGLSALAGLLVAGIVAQPLPTSAAEAAAESEAFPIGLYWPPTPEYTTPEQYDMIKEAGINKIEVPNIPGYLAVRNKDILDMSAARGIKAFVPPQEELGANAMTLTDEQLAQYVNEYKDHPGLGGYFIIDEPGPTMLSRAAEVYKKVSELDPSKEAHVNMLPYPELFQPWVDLVGSDQLAYLATDYYPYLEGSAIKPDYYAFLNQLRLTGLKNKVKTSNYLQSVGIKGYLQRPPAGYMRANVYANLAYGVKSLTWFTWWSPGNTGAEDFTDAIITREGVKTDLYEPVKMLNQEIQKLGPTLLKLDAVDVYHAGSFGSFSGLEPVPGDFFFKPGAGNNRQVIISHMKDKATGRHYIMAASKNRTGSVNMAFKLDPSWKISEVTEISKKTGKEIRTNYNPVTGELSADFLPGEGKLFAIDPSFVYQPPQTFDAGQSGDPAAQPEAGPYTNLALGKQVSATSTYEQDGWGLLQLVDGNRDGTGVTGRYGWTSFGNIYANLPDSATVDLGGVYPVDQVQLHPALGGGYFPLQYTVQVSTDNAAWTTVTQVTARPAELPNAVVHEFAPTTARYVKIAVTDKMFGNNAYHAQLAELEVYATQMSPLLIKSGLVGQLIAGQSLPLSVQRWNSDGQLEPIPADAQIAYSSHTPEVATVSADGIVTGVGSGKAVIAVTVQPGTPDEVSAEYEVTVLAFPAPWDAATQGAANAYFQVAGDVFTVQSTGTGFDSGFVYIHQPLHDAEPFTLTTTVASHRQPTEGTGGQAGLLVDGASPEGRVFFSASSAGRIQLTAGNRTILGDYAPFPIELALVGTDNQFTGYYKKAGKWVPFHTTYESSTILREVAAAGTWGLATYSGSAAKPNQAVFASAALHGGPATGADFTLFHRQLPAGAELSVAAVALGAHGKPVHAPSGSYTVQYASDAPQVATIEADGLLRTVAPGEAAIAAEWVQGGEAIAADTLQVHVLSPTWLDEEDPVVVGLPFQILEAAFRDLSDREVQALVGGQFINARAVLYNQSGEARTASVIAALYAPSGEMVNLSFLEETIAPDASGRLHAGFRLPAVTEGYELKLFVWDSLRHMAPLSDVVALTGAAAGAAGGEEE